jgi:hypothetical protein
VVIPDRKGRIYVITHIKFKGKFIAVSDSEAYGSCGPSILWFITEPDSSKPLIPKPAIGYDPQPVPFTSHALRHA